MPSPLEALIAAHMMAANNSMPSASVQMGDRGMVQKMMQQKMQQAKEQQVLQQFQSGLEQRLNPRIGTPQDTDPMVQLMMRMRGMAQPQGMVQ